MRVANQLLLVEDDYQLARSVKRFLTKEGFEVHHFVNGDNLAELIASNQFDLILCDVMLPGTNGFDIAKSLRQSFNGPFIFMTALSDVEDQLQGFNLGADDYICKPVPPPLLVARIKANLQRHKPQVKTTEKIRYGNLEIDKQRRTVLVGGGLLPLSRYEFDLLWILLEHREEQVSREYLFTKTVGREYNGMDRTVDGRISRLRKRLETNKKVRCRIYTSWGQGYMLSEKDLNC
ncbi:response regulator transcription factor [Shewanella sp.]|uniref:response regulator transcription factor n=1 Tax=Shewanella sp. TaxID=50422 RepID=UPI0035639988